MPILKSTTSVSTQPFSLRDIEQQAAAIITHAQRQAEAIIAEAQRQAAILRTQGHEQGVRDGTVEGIEKGKVQGRAEGKQQALTETKQQLAELVKSLSSASQQIESSRHALLAAAEVDVARLALSIARKIVHRLSPEPATVTGNISAAMRLVVGQNDVKIAINPTQQAVLRESLPALQLAWPNLKHVEIVADDSVSPGGAKLITHHGEVDATVESMFDRIAAELIGMSDAGAIAPSELAAPSDGGNPRPAGPA